MNNNEKFKITGIKLVGSYIFDLPKNEECTICRNSLHAPSIYNQEKGIDSYVVSGVCCHSFHNECIKSWVEKNKYCPICFEKWEPMKHTNSSQVESDKKTYDNKGKIVTKVSDYPDDKTYIKKKALKELVNAYETDSDETVSIDDNIDYNFKEIKKYSDYVKKEINTNVDNIKKTINIISKNMNDEESLVKNTVNITNNLLNNISKDINENNFINENNIKDFTKKVNEYTKKIDKDKYCGYDKDKKYDKYDKYKDIEY